MASPYDALLEPPKEESEYAALLADDQPQSEYSALLAPDTPAVQEKPLFPDPELTSVDRTLGETLGKILDFGREKINQVSPGFLSQAFSPAITGTHYAPNPDDPALKATAKAAVNKFNEVVGAVTTPAMAALLPAGAASPTLGRVIAGGFAADMASAVPGQVEQVFVAPTTQEKVEGGLGALISTLFAGEAGAHAVGRTSPLSAALKRVLGPAETRSEIPLAPETPARSAENLDVLAPEAKGLPESALTQSASESQYSTPELASFRSSSPEAITVAPEIARPRNKNMPVEGEGGTAVAQGDIDMLRRSNETRLAQAEVPAGETIRQPIGEGPQVLSTAYRDADGAIKLPPRESPMIGHEGVGVFHENFEAPVEANRGFWGIKEEGGPVEFLTREEAYDIAEVKGEVPPGVTDPTMRRLKSENYQATGEPLYKPINETISSTEGARPAPEVARTSETLGQEDVSSPFTPVESAIAQSEGAAVNKPVAVGEPLLSPGPGAAAAGEKLASYEKRRFGERFQEDAGIDPAIREQTGNRYYEPISNKVTVAEAEGIIERRGTDESIRLVRDQEFPMEPRVRVTVGEALIKKLNQSFQEATKAGDVRAPEFLEQAVDTAEYLSGYGTTLGQGVQAFAIWNKLTPEGRLMEATRIAQKSGVELKPEQVERIRKLNEEIESAPEGFQKDEKTQDLLSFMSEIKGINPADVPTALWYSNILSGFTTQLVNTIDTGLNVLAESAAMATSHPSRVPEIISGLYQGMIRGGFEAASVLKTGRSPTGDKISQQRVLERVKFGQKGGVPMTADTPIQRFMKRAFESKAATPLNLWKYPLRAMVASDTMFFNSFKEARARFLARGIAKTEGLTGDALFKRVEEALNQSPETLDAALKQAQDEGLTGLNQRRRVAEIVEQGRSEALVGDANEAAAVATYNHDPSGVLGLVAQNIANITEGFPLGKAIVPFTRIVANVANRGLNYTPWGYKRLFFGEWGGKKFATDPPVGEAYRSQLVKATLGTTAMTAVALLDANDTIQMTAKGPENPEERKQLQNAGWKPYSVKVGDTYYSYQYTPFNLGFAMIGHYRDAVRYNKLSEKDAQTRLAYGMLKSGSTIFDMSFLSGISDFIGTMQGATSSTKSAARLFSRTASSVLIPNLVKQTDKLFDPTVYQADTITQALVRETPIARSFLMKPMLNVLGEPIQPSQNRFFTFDTEDPVWKLIVEKQAWVPVPSKTSKIGDRPIKPEEYYRLVKESGPMIHEYIKSNLGKLRDMTGEDAQEDIQKESQRIRRVVKSRF